MHPKRAAASGLLAAAVLIGAGFPGDAPETPIGPRWWPSEWGAADQRGAMNRLTPDTVKAAAGLIRAGKIYSLGRVYEHGMPLPGKRHFSLTIPGSPSGGPDGANGLVYHEEMVSGELGQVGTQLDGLGHIGVRMGGDDYFYNDLQPGEPGPGGAGPGEGLRVRVRLRPAPAPGRERLAGEPSRRPLKGERGPR